MPAFAANGFGDQEAFRLGVVEAGGVELHEFHVRHPATGSPGHGNAIAGGHIRVGGIQVHLGGAAGGQYHGAGQDNVGFPGLNIVYVGTATAFFFALFPVGGVVFLHDQVHGHPVFKAGHVVFLADLFNQCAGNGFAGGVGGMNDAPVAVAAFAGQVVGQLAAVTAVEAGEVHSQINQPADGVGTVFHGEAHGIVVAQAGAGHMSIGHVAFQ